MASRILLSLAFYISVYGAPTNASSQCSPSSFTFPDLFGAELLGFSAAEVHNFTASSAQPGLAPMVPYTIDFCNVTVTYTHPGWNDTINVLVWLPLSHWNGRLIALGGGGYSATLGPLYQTEAVSSGYVAIGTDAGHISGYEASASLSEWALTSPGNVNLPLLEDWASRSLNDMTVIGKAVTTQYFAASPTYSYFSGCSGGGRQAFMLAQRYPDAYDGILAIAPAISSERFTVAAYWAAQVMQDLGAYPPPCEIRAFTAAAVEACDALDGVTDGIISAPEACGFDPHSVVGRPFVCGEDGNATRDFSAAGASVVAAAWTGPRDPQDVGNGWFGLNKDADLTASYAATVCGDGAATNCSVAPSPLWFGTIQYLLAKDPAFSPADLTTEAFFAYLRQSAKEYGAMLGAADPDLSGFRKAGGKLLSWHGLADQLIPPNGTAAYYARAAGVDPGVDDYFRYFEVPGAGHCDGGIGPVPEGALGQLIAWVEEGVVPEKLEARGADGTRRLLCPYPSRLVFEGGDPGEEGAWGCEEGEGEEFVFS